MAQEINAEKIVMKISLASVEDARTNGLVIVCETSSGVDMAGNAATRKTKCGPIVTTDDPDVVLNGSGIAVAGLTSGQASAKFLMGLMKAKRTVYFDYSNSSADAIAAGEIVELSGEGKFSNLTITSDVDDPVTTFDWEFTVGGDWSYTN